MRWCCCSRTMSEPGLLSEDPVSGLPVAHGGPPLSGVLKAQPEDFLVELLYD